ncbi:collagenase [Hathewaya massiliensis]|uniref:collagenase n=1 Tax=Hathewaya massiliensis TaxID=1964382 RepID=UPI0011580ED9|nr:collagenase [Hathewaya massiliensis]
MKKNIIEILIKNYSKESKLESLRRITSVSILVAMLTANTANVVLAKDAKRVTDNNINKIEKLKNAPSIEKENKENNEVEHALTLEEAQVKDVKPEVTLNKANSLTASPRAVAAAAKYDFSYLNTLSYSQLTELLKTIQWNDINGLFEYSTGSATFFKDKNRVQAIINALEQSGKTYTSSDMKGIPTLVEVLRAGFYLGFYYDDLAYLNDRAFQDKCIPAMLAIQNNVNFKLGTAAQDEVITSLGRLIGNASSNEQVVNNCAKILKQFIQGMDVYAENYAKGTAVHTLMKEIEYDFSSATYNKSPKDMPWYGKIDPFVEELKNLALYGKVTEGNAWVINNGIYYLANIGIYANKDNEIRKNLTDAMNMYTKYGEQYFNAVDRLSVMYNGIDSNGNKIDINKIVKEGTNYYLPKTYTFDNGSFVIKAGARVSEEKVKRLYWAAKEVKSQFHRVIGNDKALEQGNTDDVLTMQIFNDPKEYKMNTYLTGISTDNGGIYIESQGTFYTYERTPEESIYSLEELFRHEFTHYLQGRYLVRGMWGEGPFYEKPRITWYEEGTAEFFAGSTRTGGIVPRKSVTSYIPTNSSKRFSLNQTVNATYDNGGDVYTYGFALSNYMYAKDMPTFAKINKAILNNDVTSYDRYIKELANDSSKNQSYQAYMQSLVDNYNNLTVPLVSDDYLKDHGYKKDSEVYADITRAASLKDVKTSKENSQFFNTFTLRGTYVGEVSKGEREDWNNMSKKLDDVLKSLGQNSWSGYKTLTAYFTNYKVTSDNKVQYDIVFHGVSTDNGQTGNENKAPIVKLTAPSTGIAGREVSFSSNGTIDEDGSIASYLWNFGDGKTSREANPVHVFENAGDYTVTLRVTDDKGAMTTESVSLKIVKEDTSTPTDKEMEPNNDFNNANGPIISGTSVKGIMEGRDTEDVFYFDVEKDGEVTIEVPYTGDSQFTWLVYKAGNDNYLSHGLDKGNTKTNTFNATKGRYYLYLYKYDESSKVSYSINLKGNTSTPNPNPEEQFIYEKEENGSMDKANIIPNFNSTVLGGFDYNDSNDYYVFDVNESGNVNIEVTKLGNFGANWVLYREGDNRNYVSYAKADGNKLVNGVNLSRGKYYLCVYKTSGTGDYEVRIRR